MVPQAASSTSKSNVPEQQRMAASSYLPEELWERIFTFVNGDDHIQYNDIDENGMLADNITALSPSDSFKSLSVVSKEFLSITNRLRFSVKISKRTIPLLHLLFKRFPNITSLNITLFCGDLDMLLTRISTFPIDIKSLTLRHPSAVPKNGLRSFSKKMKNLTSFTCYQMTAYIHKNDLSFIAHYFPLLEELILTVFYLPIYYEHEDQLLALPKLRKIALARTFIGRQSINDLCKNSDLLHEVKVIKYLP